MIDDSNEINLFGLLQDEVSERIGKLSLPPGVKDRDLFNAQVWAVLFYFQALFQDLGGWGGSFEGVLAIAANWARANLGDRQTEAEIREGILKERKIREELAAKGLGLADNQKIEN